jgi:YNFM family putative membrane transporter
MLIPAQERRGVWGGAARPTQSFFRTNLALFSAGLATFALMYAVQPLMPVFSTAFHVSPAASSLTLSLTTLPLALSMLGASALADRHGRKPVMVASLLASATLSTACAAAPGLPALLVLRALMGISLGGLPSIAMTYVAEEMAPAAVGLAMGLFIGGSAIGGMSGRLLAGLLAAHVNWRVALAAIGGEGFTCALLLARFLPAGRVTTRQSIALRSLGRAAAGHLRTPIMRRLFGQGFLLMGSFVTIYNYVAYRLLAPPYALNPDHVSLIFSVYLVGVVTSSVMGHAALRRGRRRILLLNIALMLAGVALTLPAWLPALVLGIAIFTAGFFGAHSVASAWVGAAARQDRAQASALYLLAYYIGGSLAGTLAGLLWPHAGWPAIAAFVAAMLTLAAILRPS